MKFLNILLVIYIALSSSHVADASTGESDVIRVFNPNMKMTPERLKYFLDKAKLEDAGFSRSEETRYETDDKGKKNVKRTTYYMVQDDCSKSEKWMTILSERLPKQVYGPELKQKMEEEIEQRIDGRETEYCRFGLEIHLHICGENEERSPTTRVRRAMYDCDGYCACCGVCGVSQIQSKTLGPER